MLGAAGALLIAALVWSVLLGSNGFTARVERQLASHGVSVRAADLEQHSFKKQTSIRALLDGQDVSEAVEASLAAGFPSDIESTGDVICLIAPSQKGVLTVYVVDDAVELAFIQTEEGGILPPNE